MAKKKPPLDAALACLLADIRESPREDGPRRILSDWLEENGRPEQAQYVRIKLEQAKEKPCGPRWRKLRDEMRALHQKHHNSWFGPGLDTSANALIPDETGTLHLCVFACEFLEKRKDFIAHPAYAWAEGVTLYDTSTEDIERLCALDDPGLPPSLTITLT